ncbi:MAG TPA: hypothetical protein VG713_03560 [Pirellulales bacterium]|nr:hypothetical protein [Pirellulales bacterium]
MAADLCGRVLEGCKDHVREAEIERSSRALPSGQHGYAIVAPRYNAASVGVRCLYRLCDELNRRGYPSYIVGSTRCGDEYAVPRVGWWQARQWCRNGFIAVYPETVSGNPCNAATVARWALNQPGFIGGDLIWDDRELVFIYSEVYRRTIRNQIAGKLYMPMIDESIFHCDDLDLTKRSLECFYVGKSRWQDGVVDRQRAFEITRRTPARHELGKLLRASRVLYSFDNSTMLIYEALMCGCPVVVVPDGTHTREDYQALELGMAGIAWGPEELATVGADVAQLHRRYEQSKRDFEHQLEQFIAITQRHARGERAISPGRDPRTARAQAA